MLRRWRKKSGFECDKDIRMMIFHFKEWTMDKQILDFRCFLFVALSVEKLPRNQSLRGYTTARAVWCPDRVLEKLGSSGGLRLAGDFCWVERRTFVCLPGFRGNVTPWEINMAKWNFEP